MRKLRGISQLLTVIAFGMAVFELVYQWVAKARFKIRTVQELWTEMDKVGFETARSLVQSILGLPAWQTISNLPAPAFILILAAFFYLIYRIMFLLAGQDKSTAL